MKPNSDRDKGPDAFRTIGEAATEVGVAPHVLRFWEGKFAGLKPLKRGGGRRYYRPRDIALLHQIKRLLHDEGYTIKGAQKLLRSHGAGNPDIGGATSNQSAEDTAGAGLELSLPLPEPAIADGNAGNGLGVGELQQIAKTLHALAEECANVAAGKPPPSATD